MAKNLFPNKNPIGEKIAISGGKYTVIGVAGEKGSVFGQDQDNVVIVPYTAARKQFSVDTVNYIYLSAKSPELVSLVKKRANDVLLTRFDEEDFTIMTQEQTLDTVRNITSILTVALGGIAAISLLVGGIGVMNIMLVSVTERTKEIGLRKALGAKRKDILLQFLLEAVMLSLFWWTCRDTHGLWCITYCLEIFCSRSDSLVSCTCFCFFCCSRDHFWHGSSNPGIQTFSY